MGRGSRYNYEVKTLVGLQEMVNSGCGEDVKTNKQGNNRNKIKSAIIAVSVGAQKHAVFHLWSAWEVFQENLILRHLYPISALS